MAELSSELIDLLIQRIHTDWPRTPFVLQAPSGERVLVPSHAVAGPSCTPGHARYFADLVVPFCELDPIRRGGLCRLTPLTMGDGPISPPTYALDLRSGVLTIGATSAAGAVPTGDRGG